MSMAALVRGLLALLLACLAPAALAAAGQAAAPAPYVPALWQVSSGKSTAWLFGTVHALPRGVDWFAPHVARALDQSSMLVLETDIPDSPSALAPVVMRLSRLPSPRPVADRVPESWRPALKAATERLRTGPMEWSDTWFIALTLTNLQSEHDGIDPRIGVEPVLTERARMQGIPVRGLETPEEQLTNFDSLPEADQQMLLVTTLADLGDSRARMDLMVDDWMHGRTDALAQRVNTEFERSPMLRRLLVEDRNSRWADWLAQKMQTDPGPIFVAVGAGHLAGKGSLIEELERRGLTVKRMSPEPPPAAKPGKKRRR